jgi:hypothetical protein
VSSVQDSGETRQPSIVAAINLTVSLVTVGILLFYQVPLFNADRKLKEMDTSIREIEKSVALQKNSLDLLRSNFGTAEGAMKIIDNLTPSSSIQIQKALFGPDYCEIIWIIENHGEYSFEENAAPEITFSRTPLNADGAASDPTLKILYRSSPMGVIAPKTSQLHTAKVFRPSKLSTIYWRIKVSLDASPRVVKLAKKILPAEFASDIQEASSQYRLFYGHIDFQEK